MIFRSLLPVTGFRFPTLKMKVYGINPVLEALRSQADQVEHLLVTRGKSNPRLNQAIELARKQGVGVRFEAAQVLQKQSGTNRHQNLVAVLSEASLADLEEILQAKPRLLLAVDSVEDPRNLGALLRTAEAAGVEGVLLPQRRSSGITPAVVKASAGAALHLKIASVGNLARGLERIKQAGIWTVGLDMSGNDRPDTLDASLPLAVVVGGEHRGLRPVVRRQCDFLVSIPMQGRVNSLNLSVAAGILLYQIVLERFRAKTPSTPRKKN
ncbi:MAG: 23S rRNA (guanosine(2251)-2'-O)-methyltransferase RlmB [Acidobacteriota bacterium]